MKNKSQQLINQSGKPLTTSTSHSQAIVQLSINTGQKAAMNTSTGNLQFSTKKPSMGLPSGPDKKNLNVIDYVRQTGTPNGVHVVSQGQMSTPAGQSKQ